MPDRPRPLLLVLALVLAVVAPAAVAAAVGLAGGAADDQAEIASTAGGGGGRGRERSTGAETDGEQPEPGSGRHLVGDGPGMTNAGPTTTVPPVPPTTAATVPATTVPPPPPPPTTAPPPTAPPAPPVVPPTDQVVALVNVARADHGCPALRIDDRLVAAAQAHSDDMGVNDYFSHDSLDGRTFADRIEAAGYPSPGGENIARGQRDAQAVHDAWMESSGHRANILNCEFTAIGVGLHEATWTWTQDFGF